MTDYVRAIEERREEEQAALHGFPSVLAAVARHEHPIGQTVRLYGVTIAATPDGFIVDGVPSGPRIVDAGRHALRLSHQGYPAVVVQDREAPRRAASLRWYPVDPALRVRGRIAPDPAPLAMSSTASPDRRAERVGWFTFSRDGRDSRLSVTRLLEPGASPDQLEIYFRDATTGHDSYEVGRYVTVEREGNDVVVDFNRAYNPSCALSPYYNCPIPRAENHLAIPIRAGEMTPLLDRPHG
ncbi:MAG TPA: DUF1684 domain-containing protein [Candidatus Acidoferrales bacterium]|nr:DUF1684 domain-containing protein [Candidatus Acidoferrales bacterium]